jgi:hypothetical protein
VDPPDPWLGAAPELQVLKGSVRAAAIVMAREFFDDPPEMPLVDWDEVVETLAEDGADRPFAEGVGCRSSRRSPQDVDAKAFPFGVETRRKDRVTVMDQEAVSVVSGARN